MEGDYPSNWVLDERVQPGRAYMFGEWQNPLLEELRERRAAEVAGSGIKWPSLREGTLETERQFHEHMMEWAQDDIMVFDTGDVYHSRWGYTYTPADRARARVPATADWKKSLGIPELADKRSGARYWPIGRV